MVFEPSYDLPNSKSRPSPLEKTPPLTTTHKQQKIETVVANSTFGHYKILYKIRKRFVLS